MVKAPCTEPQLAVRAAAQHVVEGEPPLDRVGRVRRPADVEQAPPAVVDDDVDDDGGRAGEVVGRHHVGGLRDRGPGDDDHGKPRGQALDVPGRGEPLADDDPVHLARQGNKLRLACLARPHEGAEEQPLAVADRCLHAALHLVVLQQALGLDVVLSRLLAPDAHRRLPS